jgi:uncharacterized protein (DUF488 family)
MTTIYTIGYEGTDIARFLATLRAVGIDTVVDVRALALSRKKGFSKRALASSLAAEGIRYVHMPALGDPKPGREAARAGRHAEFRRIYSEHLLGIRAQTALVTLAKISAGGTTCLLCFERDPEVCHRSIVATRLGERGMRIVDLFGDQPGQYVDYAKYRKGGHSRQGAAAA